MSKNIKTAIDIGTHSIKVLVGEKTKDGIEILTSYKFPHFGLKKGEVYNTKTVTDALLNLSGELEKEKDIKLSSASFNINGPHLFLEKNQGLVSVSRADRKISEQDIERVISASESISLPSNKEVVSVITKEFLVDGERINSEPIGLEGMRLEAKVLLICVFSPVLNNLGKAVSDAGLELEETTPNFISTANAVLTQEQMDIGSCVLDLGSGTTSLSIFKDGSLEEFKILPMGSSNITNDIAIGLRTDIRTAEKIKTKYGYFDTSKRKGTGKNNEIIDFEDLKITKTQLRDIIRPRINEIFDEVHKVLKPYLKDRALPGGIVITGGGSNLPGLIEYAKEKFGLPAKQGVPHKELDPSFSSCYGILEETLKDTDSSRKSGNSIFKKIIKIVLP